MKIAIFESITTPGGHEVDFDRILVEELKALGHEVVFYVPEDFIFKMDYGVDAVRLPGKGVSYTGARGIRKLLLSAKRELNRQRWFSGIYGQAIQGAVDAVIVPTSTYRYLRALNHNRLKQSPVPVLFILHGVNPGEAPKLFRELKKLEACPNIKAVALTFGDTIFGETYPNLTCTTPPAYLPRDLEPGTTGSGGEWPAEDRPLILGFFGQYRREKKLDEFLDAFLTGQYSQPVKLLVQGSTMNPDDSEDFQRIIAKYKGCSHIEFLHKGLIGKEWQQAIAAVDVLLMPYSAPRYRYHWGGMLFTAIGYKKPVVLSDEINPEVMAKYRIGMAYASGQAGSLQATLQEFINTYAAMAPAYARELERAYEEYHPRAFAARLAEMAR